MFNPPPSTQSINPLSSFFLKRRFAIWPHSPGLPSRSRQAPFFLLIWGGRLFLFPRTSLLQTTSLCLYSHPLQKLFFSSCDPPPLRPEAPPSRTFYSGVSFATGLGVSFWKFFPSLNRPTLFLPLFESFGLALEIRRHLPLRFFSFLQGARSFPSSWFGELGLLPTRSLSGSWFLPRTFAAFSLFAGSFVHPFFFPSILLLSRPEALFYLWDFFAAAFSNFWLLKAPSFPPEFSRCPFKWDRKDASRTPPSATPLSCGRWRSLSRP